MHVKHKVNLLTATPMGIPRLRKNPYILAAMAQSSTLEIAWIPTLTLVKTMPVPMPKIARAT